MVSAFEGVTNQLLAEAAEIFGDGCDEALAAYVSTGEQQSAALLVGSLRVYGLPVRLIEPREIGLLAEGPILESDPRFVDRDELWRLWESHPILVLPGFYGVNGWDTRRSSGAGDRINRRCFWRRSLGPAVGS